MGLASALTVLVMAPFAILWARIAPYHCLLSEDLTGIEGSRNISALYIRGRAGNVCQVRASQSPLQSPSCIPDMLPRTSSG